MCHSPATCPAVGWSTETLEATLGGVIANSGGRLARRVLGRSWEGRPIEVIEAGNGPKRVVAWSHMHGDEQTFTTTVVNLLRMIASPTESPGEIGRVLERCRLSIVPMLNPDGAHRRTRVNAQGVDINRDALQNASPEGALLAGLIKSVQPHYALNLHNQSHRRWMPGHTAPVSLSLLAPPANPACRPTDAVKAAQRLAACVVGAAQPACGGRITRYDAGYMPRAFGEWVQSTGVPTVLLEAGGWPGQDVAALESLCLRALLAALSAIASGECEQASCFPYDALPLASEWESFDLMIQRARLASPGGESTAVDIGVNRPNNSIMPTAVGAGTVVDVGDLHVFPCHDVLEAKGLLCEAGRVTVLDGAIEGGRIDRERVAQRVREGATTVLATLEADPNQLPAAVASLTSGPPPDAVMGLLWRPPNAAAAAVNLPPEVVGLAPPATAPPAEGPSSTRLPAIGSPADLVLREPTQAANSPSAAPARHVLVGGTVVVRDGRLAARGAGRWLRRENAAWIAPH